MGTSLPVQPGHTDLDTLSEAVIAYAADRIPGSAPARQAAHRRPSWSARRQTITPGGLAAPGDADLRRRPAPSCLSTDHPRYLSFIPVRASDAPRCSTSSGASSIHGALARRAGAYMPENLALRWIADLAGVFATRRGIHPGGAMATCPRWWPHAIRHGRGRRPGAPNRLVSTGGAQFDQIGGRGDGRRVRRVPSMRTGAAGANLRSVPSNAAPRTSSPSSRPPGRRTAGSSTISPRSACLPREFGYLVPCRRGPTAGLALRTPPRSGSVCRCRALRLRSSSIRTVALRPIYFCALLYRDRRSRLSATQRRISRCLD